MFGVGKWKVATWILAVLAVLTTDAMCAAVGYNYCNLLWGMRYGHWSAGPSVAFVLCVPFMAVAILFAVGAVLTYRKYKKGE